MASSIENVISNYFPLGQVTSKVSEEMKQAVARRYNNDVGPMDINKYVSNLEDEEQTVKATIDFHTKLKYLD